VQLQPSYFEAHSNLGLALAAWGRPAEAEASFRRALELRPDLAEAHFNLGSTLLLQGDFLRGWLEYEWRWRCPNFTPRNLPQPFWDGASLQGRTILLYAEQGLGDTLQFVRYAALAKERGGKVLLECMAELASLLSRCPGVDQVIPRGTRIPPFDVQAPLLSL